jgi:hypothetical protein
LKIFSNVIGNQFSEYPLKVLVKDGSPPRPHLCRPHVSVLMDMFEYGKAEPDNSFVLFTGGWKFRRVNRAKHVMYAANKQIVFVTEVHIKG